MFVARQILAANFRAGVTNEFRSTEREACNFSSLGNGFVAWKIIHHQQGRVDTCRRLIGLYCEQGMGAVAFLKIKDTLDIFHRLEKDFSFKQRLNNFAKIINGILKEGFVREKSFGKSLDYPG